MANQIGKRYKCEGCGTEVLYTKKGDGAIVYCGQEMAVVQPRQLPSSD